jgi:4-hydroxythreonine-4-phosphate dehydrogenase
VTELVVSTGDPQGVGPEVSVRAGRAVARRRPGLAVVLAGDRSVLLRAGADPAWPAAPAGGPAPPGMSVLETPLPEPLAAAPPSGPGGRAALAALGAALSRVVADPRARALVTAPISKEAARIADPAFDGHTGFLGKRLSVPAPVMLFSTPSFRVALLTVHVPLGEVPPLVTADRLRQVVTVTRADLRARFGVLEPRIHVLGLNPHAGENGGIGVEEREVLVPAIARLAAEGFSISGPFPADSYFRPGFETASDVVVAMYHDQGLLPVKCLAFGEAVNVTLGLPIVRTSVDHGTAFDRAWKGGVESTSMEHAMDLACELLERPRSG